MPALDAIIKQGYRRALYYGVLAVAMVLICIPMLGVLSWIMGAFAVLLWWRVFKNPISHIAKDGDEWQIWTTTQARASLRHARVYHQVVWLDLDYHFPIHTRGQVVIFKDEMQYDDWCALRAHADFG